MVKNHFKLEKLFTCHHNRDLNPGDNCVQTGNASRIHDHLYCHHTVRTEAQSENIHIFGP